MFRQILAKLSDMKSQEDPFSRSRANTRVHRDRRIDFNRRSAGLGTRLTIEPPPLDWIPRRFMLGMNLLTAASRACSVRFEYYLLNPSF